MIRRQLLKIAVLLAAGAANAQGFPTGPVKIVSAYPPAGGVDITARIIAPELAKRLGQSVIIENKAGERELWAAPSWREPSPTATPS
jgi:tripartite-type tricarboxylate transporter receptor subunit TctC